MNKLFKAFLSNWVWLCGIAGVITGIVLFAKWDSLSILLRINLISFIAMNLHEVEEYGWPGGTPIMVNNLQRGNKLPFNKEAFPADAPVDRYPLNQLSAMWGNCLIVFTCYLFPIIWPEKIALSMMPIFMGMLQLFIHGGQAVSTRAPYNPGLFSVAAIQVPLGIYYIYYITTNNLTTGTTWAIGIAYLIFVMVFVVALPTYRFFPNLNSKYPFSEAEIKKYERIKKLMRK